MQTWQVSLDYSRDMGPAGDEFVSALAAVGTELGGAAVGGGRKGLSVTLAVQAGDYLSALSGAAERVAMACRHHGIEPGDVVEAQARTWERADADLGTPNYPDIVGAAEAAEILGVSRQRVHQLLRENPRFPEPLYRLRGTGPLWVRAGIEAFTRRWERKPGRPPKAAAAVG
jgi:hypothetical protein